MSELYSACKAGNLEEVKRLFENGIGSDGNVHQDCLHGAVASGNLALLRYLVEDRSMEIETMGANNYLDFSCLSVACAWNNLPMVKYLAEERGASTSGVFGCDETLLMITCYEGDNYEVVKYLVEEHSVDIDAKNDDGCTALMIACRENHLSIVKYLVETANANVSVEDASGNNCMLTASRWGNVEVVRYLLGDVNINTQVKNDDGYTCLLQACTSRNNLPLIKYLVEEVGMDIHQKDKRGNDCLLLACENGDLPMVQYLIEEGHANVEVRNNAGENCLLCTHITFGRRDLSIETYLVENCSIDIEEKDNSGQNVLMRACMENRLSFVKYLIEERQADLEAVDADGNNCLYYACRQGNVRIMEYLIIDQWMEPPPHTSFIARLTGAREYLKQCSKEYLSEKRREVWTRERHNVNQFIRESQLQQKWNIRQKTTFIQGVPLFVTHVLELLESNPGPPADLKVCFRSPSEQIHVVYAKKDTLSKSCSFMRNLLTGEMNDVQDDPEYEGMQMVELSPDLIQDCPAEWLKQLIAFLSWSREGDSLQHMVGCFADNAQLLFDEIEEGLKYCRMCHTLGIDVDVSVWTDFIKKYVEKYNNQWIESALEKGKVGRMRGTCIRYVKRFDQKTFDLWTRILGRSDEVCFFMLVNAAPATAETRSTVASECREWFISVNSSKKYSKTLANPFFVGILQMHTNFNFSSGVAFVPVSNFEDFVPRKRRKTEK